MMQVFVYISCGCVIGVYDSRDLAERLGKTDSLERFGVEGYVSDFPLTTDIPLVSAKHAEG